MKPPLFETTRTIVREFVTADIEPFSNYRSLPEVAAYQSWNQYSYQDGLALFEEMQRAPFGTVGCWFQVAITHRDNGMLFGDLALHFIDDQQVEIGFTIDPQFQRQKIGTEAVIGCLNYLFGQMKTHRVRAITDTENEGSWRLLERVGFRREAHFIDHVWFKGAWGSEYLYALLAREWMVKQKGYSEANI